MNPSDTRTIPPEWIQSIAAHDGPLKFDCSLGQIIVMRRDVYDAMLGIGDDDEAGTLASVRRGLADVDAGRVHDVNAVLTRLFNSSPVVPSGGEGNRI